MAHQTMHCRCRICLVLKDIIHAENKKKPDVATLRPCHLVCLDAHAIDAEADSKLLSVVQHNTKPTQNSTQSSAYEHICFSLIS